MLLDTYNEEYRDIFMYYKNLIPLIDDIVQEPLIIILYDREYCLYIRNLDEFSINLKEGDRISEKTVAFASMKQDKVLTNLTPREIFGFLMKTTSIPIKKDNVIIGCLAICRSLKNQDEYHALSEQLFQNLEQITIAINNVATSVQHVAVQGDNILKEINSVKLKADNTNQVLNIIREVSNKTKLLGLNSLIESARAGEYGRGFNVVAKEIQKLSETTNDSVKSVNNIIKELVESIDNISKIYSDENTEFQNQSAVLEELSASTQELNTISKVLVEKALASIK
ncbi:putative sensory transducer protein YfmS [Clostridium homopropionicum DSM 5847]|uniref:Putative sensory transducer protein YfmS n=1 Tax=Clostridium homopropionicum DSM 5847 TaxID=1121318 RepID=A0A0L6Z9W0_9CLOT|nr:methyl-accepting chemotaxis protein [Clostridium homopropionicum]KOA19747.1 putative sensory transducer protein YfmS [Clostridium homopropionicum DSM 5847]SFF78396.1 Methyl-accepting chemotaxis protein (MCP) signalling domain-containing protein [Clostridium homopropionicum]